MTARPQPTAAELEAAWTAGPQPARGRGSVRLLCVRLGGGVHECPAEGVVTPADGLVGDRWAAAPRRRVDAQLTLMNARVAELVGGRRLPLDTPGDNVLVDFDLSEEALPAGTRLRLGEALIEVTALPHTGCKKFRDRFGLDALQWVNTDPSRRLRGANCRVLEPGRVAVGDAVELACRVLFSHVLGSVPGPRPNGRIRHRSKITSVRRLCTRRPRLGV